ncbi:hypothetical protein M436DRAFT_59577 [Aureobasidium namibiae CBS 147.97]|uniref:Uncharacterized protein n=1 Tax=Aureobasidium namibiae CBS 147.97 TaxID=1043004 RepID=A0A074WWN2_9PEZI|nr:uncharacterized protein M436DRAFT_59577 [Aureobasidium namibiae CBS 147.97]KEQ77598.1 hypothetical protein M436DRAFT_59577 [Aureobasidium namibiae CBS 147.97]
MDQFVLIARYRAKQGKRGRALVVEHNLPAGRSYAGQIAERRTKGERRQQLHQTWDPEAAGLGVARSAIVSSEKVRGALFDDGHGMRKRKDSPPVLTFRETIRRAGCFALYKTQREPSPVKDVHPSCVHPLKPLSFSSTAADCGILARSQSHTPLQGLAAPRLSQTATKHPCPNHPRFPRNTSSPASRQQSCARKSSTSSNAVISKSTWPLAPRRESQSVPIPKTRRSITINAARIAKDNTVRLF